LALAGDQEAVRQALRDPQPTVQALALDLVAVHQPQEAVPLLVAGTRSAHAAVRLRALDLLTNSQADAPTVRAALGEAMTDEDMQVKSYALQALATRGGAEAVGYLRQALHDPSPSVRLLAIDQIVSALPPAHRVPLLQEVALDEDAMVRAAAASWLEDAGAAGQ
jgi:HEAT repeat protein